MARVHARGIASDPTVSPLASVRKRMTSMDRLAASFASQHALAKVAIIAIAVAIYVVSAMVAPGVPGIMGGILSLLMLAIVLTDARFFIIPNALTGTALVFGLLQAGLEDRPETVLVGVVTAIARGAVLASAFLAVRVGYRWLRGREGMGLGDVKLAAVAGIWLDWLTIPLAVEIAALSALVVYALHQIVLRRPMQTTVRLPFGVFLAPAIWLGWLIDVTLQAPQ
jgi:leader peptidase (prepilin peptidase) / N-methyltransferase